MTLEDNAHGESSQEFPWHLGVYDAHCHPTDTMSSIDAIPGMKARVLTAMATRMQDQALVAEVNQKIGVPSQDPNFDGDCKSLPCQTIPAFGWHPWFSHQLYDDRDTHQDSSPSKVEHYREVVTPKPDDGAFVAALPDPRPLSQYLEQTREALKQHPLAMVGEIGLDKSFRIPEFNDCPKLLDAEPALTPGGREGRRLSPYRVDMQHQRLILKAQLNLAGEMCRPVSVHGVGAHGVVYETLRETWEGYEKPVISKRLQKRRASAAGAHSMEEQDETTERPMSRPYPPRICLHSFSGPPETAKQYLHPCIPAVIFFSFSQVINFTTVAAAKAVEVIKALPDDRILVESDLHCAGERMDGLLEDIVRLVCREKGWSLEQGTQQLAANWKHFALGWT